MRCTLRSAKMLVTQYKSKDKPKVLDLWWDSWHSVSGFQHPKSLQEWEPRFDNLLKNNIIHIAKIDNCLAGFIMYDIERSEISQLFVAPSYHRRGVGSELLNIASIAMNNIFSLKVLETASTSRNFYESFGLIEIGKELNPFNGKTEIIYASPSKLKNETNKMQNKTLHLIPDTSS